MFAGRVAAVASGAAHARILFSSDGFIHLRNTIRGSYGDNWSDPLREWLGPIRERYGYDFGEENVVGQWTIDPSPPWHWRPAGTNHILMRGLHFNGGTQVPE